MNRRKWEYAVRTHDGVVLTTDQGSKRAALAMLIEGDTLVRRRNRKWKAV